MACFGSKAPVGRFLDASGAALGRFLAHFGRLLGGSWAVLGTKMGRPKASWRHLGGVLGEIWRLNGAKLGVKSEKSWILCKISVKAQNYYFSNRF